MSRRLAILLLGAAALAASGCGYGLVGRTSNLPTSVRDVFLKPIENRTSRAQVEQIVGQALADELVTRQRFALKPSAEGADAVLSGAILSFLVQPITFDEEGRGLQYEIAIVAQMKFEERSVPPKTLWANDRYVFRDTYEIEPSDRAYFDREILAVRRVAVRFAETVVTDLLEGF